ncbi:MAG: DNA polymerase-3 subunit delta' [Verrucomicrobiales bacterium]|jgi:DNA polymerase-3 subunit delta'
MSFVLDDAFQYLERGYSHERLAHAYLITGPDGSGKRELAARLIALVNKVEVGTLDEMMGDSVRVVRPESRSRIIKVAQMRELEKSFYMSGASGKMKVGVIDEADRMVEAAENAFLKTLEEPPVGCLLIMITAYPEQLLDTILSRCIQVPLRVTQQRPHTEREKVLLESLAKYSASGKRSPSRALGLMSRFTMQFKEVKAEIGKDHAAALKRETELYQKTTEGDWLKKRDEYYKALTESMYLHQRTGLVELLVSWLADALRCQVGYGRLDFPQHAEVIRSLAENLEHRDLTKRLGALEDLRTNLATNVQEALAMEVAFIQAFG